MHEILKLITLIFKGKSLVPQNMPRNNFSSKQNEESEICMGEVAEISKKDINRKHFQSFMRIALTLVHIGDFCTAWHQCER